MNNSIIIAWWSTCTLSCDHICLSFVRSMIWSVFVCKISFLYFYIDQSCKTFLCVPSCNWQAHHWLLRWVYEPWRDPIQSVVRCWCIAKQTNKQKTRNHKYLILSWFRVRIQKKNCKNYQTWWPIWGTSICLYINWIFKVCNRTEN